MIRRLARDAKGVGAVEYGLLAAAIAFAGSTLIGDLGDGIRGKMDEASQAMAPDTRIGGVKVIETDANGNIVVRKR